MFEREGDPILTELRVWGRMDSLFGSHHTVLCFLNVGHREDKGGGMSVAEDDPRCIPFASKWDPCGREGGDTLGTDKGTAKKSQILQMEDWLQMQMQMMQIGWMVSPAVVEVNQGEPLD